MRLVFVISTLAAGGAQKVLCELANGWGKAGWDVTVVTFSGEEDAPFFTMHPQVSLVRLGVAGEARNVWQGVKNNWRRVVVLRSVVRRLMPDVVISFMTQENILSLLSTRGLGIPVVISERVDPVLSPLGIVWQALRRATYLLADRIVFQTERMKSAFSDRIQSRSEVIPNAITIPPSYQRSASRGLIRSIVGMGRLTHQKGFDLLIRAFASLTLRYPDWRLRILGDGPLRGELEELSRLLGIEQRVDLSGNTRDPYAVFKTADLFVLPSRFEGFPNALCEAMACGVPVVAADCRTGPREVVEHGTNGLLAKPDDPESLAVCMERLMSNEEERKRMGAHAASILQRFSLERIVEKWETLLLNVVEQRGMSVRGVR